MGCVFNGTEIRDYPKDTYLKRTMGLTGMLPSAADDNSCQGCRALWEAYAAAITNHIRLEKLLLTAMRQNCDIVTMEADAEKADVERERLREAIRTHKERVHRSYLLTFLDFDQKKRSSTV